MENLSYLMAAYSVVWVAISGYLYYIVVTQKKLEAEVKELKTKISG